VTARDRAVEALSRRLRDLLPEERAAAMVGHHVAAFEDNLVPTLTPEQIVELRCQLKAGDGKELEPRARGAPPDAHAAHSSAVLAFNAFGGWLGKEQRVTAAGVRGFSRRLEVEKKQPIQRGGRAPNLDVLLTGDDVVAGVESKLTEWLTPHRRRTWQESYSRPDNLALLDGGWRETLRAAIAGDYHPLRLEAAQLLRHALGIARQHPGSERHLVYVWWEPLDADDLPEAVERRAEVAELLARVADASPRLHALTYRELFTEWEQVTDDDAREHVQALRDRYELALAKSTS
jgi:hypothetical protein